MHINEIQLKNFQSYLSAQWAPAQGLTLISGPNGAGKSTMAEAVCWGLYGQTVRGSAPEMLGSAATTVEICFGHKGHAWQITRHKTGANTKLAALCDGVDVSGQTMTDTQARLDRLLGTWERFTATRIFAKEFIAKFGAATDKERKELLEEMLGLERFGEVAEVMRARVKVAGDRQINLAGQYQGLQRRREMLAAQPHLKVTRALADIRTEQNAAANEAARRQTQQAQLQEMIRGLEDAQRASAATMNGKRSKAGQLRAEGDRLKNKLIALQARAECPTCFQGIDQAAQVHIAQTLLSEHARQVEMAEGLEAEANDVQGEVDDLSASREGVRRQLDQSSQDAGKLRTRLSDLAVEEREAEVIGSMRDARLKDEQQLDSECGQIQGLLAEAKAQAALMTAVAEVYGLRGARHLLLGRALRQLEGMTNQVLARLGLPIQIGISPSSQLKSGKNVDAISFSLVGAGGGAYRGASGGERGRVDVAVLLALAQLLGPDAEGWVAFDEVFDALDQDGIARVGAYLEGLARSRQVLVITHNPEAQSLFPRAAALRAEKDPVGGSTLVNAT